MQLLRTTGGGITTAVQVRMTLSVRQHAAQVQVSVQGRLDHPVFVVQEAVVVATVALAEAINHYLS